MTAPSSDWVFEHPTWLRVTGRVGAGSFGSVVKCVEVNPPEGEEAKEYALKKIRDYGSMPGKIQEPYARKICREVETLSMMQGAPHIIPLKMIYLSEDKKDVYMLMPLINFDLQDVVQVKSLQEDEIKWVAYQILLGMKHVHDRRLMHRDLTLKNIFVSDTIDAFIGDFGLARAHQTAENTDITLDVVTLEYRAPELLLQYKKYDARVDMWSVGCMIAELYLGRRLLVPQRRDVPCQLIRIMQSFGKPDPDFVSQHASTSAAKFFGNIMSRFDALEHNNDIPKSFDPPVPIQLAAAGASAEGIDVIMGLLQFDFRKRLSAEAALKMPWFTNDSGYDGCEAVSSSGSDIETPGSPLGPSAVERHENGDITEGHDVLNHLQQGDIEVLRQYMENKATSVELVRGEYAGTENAHVSLA